MWNLFRIKLKQTSYDYASFAAVIDGINLQKSDQQSNVIKNYKRFIELLKNSDIEPKEIYDTIQKLEVVDVNLEISDELKALAVERLSKRMKWTPRNVFEINLYQTAIIRAAKLCMKQQKDSSSGNH